MSALLVNFAQGGLQVLAVGLVLGAGLPAVFALGIRALAWADGGDAEVGHGRPQPLGRLLAALCFLVVAAGVLLGLAVIVSRGVGLELGLDGIVPTISREE